MNRQVFSLFRILLNPHITATPRRVLKELRRQGKARLPEQLEAEASRKLYKPNLLPFLRRWLDGELLSRHQGQWVLNSFLPPFPGRAYDRMFENLLSGRRLSPVSAFLAVTASCPCNCWHCSAKERRDGSLNTEQWCTTIDSLHELGASIIAFTGGEPLERDDLAELVHAAADGGAATILFTSGWGFDRKRAAALQHQGLWSVCVSLDHPDPYEYDKLRQKPGTHAQALSALQLAKDQGFYTMMASVASKDFLAHQHHRDLYQTARSLGIDEYRIVEPMPCGKLEGAGGDVLLQSEQIEALRTFHVETNRKGRLPKVCAFNQIESPELFGCGAGTQHLYIDSAGEVCPCDFTPLSFGNVQEVPLASIWERMNNAMGNPRRHCFVHHHHKLIAAHAKGGYPLSPERSEEICCAAGTGELPDYFAFVCGQAGQAAEKSETEG